MSLRVANAALVALSHMYRGWWSVVFGPVLLLWMGVVSAHLWTSGIYFHVYYDWYSKQSVPLVEEWNMLTTIRTIGRRAESVVGCKPVFFVLVDAAVFACTFPRPFVVVKRNQLYSETKNV